MTEREALVEALRALREQKRWLEERRDVVGSTRVTSFDLGARSVEIDRVLLRLRPYLDNSLWMEATA